MGKVLLPDRAVGSWDRWPLHLTPLAESESILILMAIASPQRRRRDSALRPPETSGSLGGSRVDPQSRSREEVGFFGPQGRRIFTCTHLPATKPIGGVVICSPLHAEFLHNYRKEVILARSLAVAGLAVQRFHYRGSGNSDGGAENVTFESMLGDTLEAVEFLESYSNVDSLAFLGTRLSALVASAAAKRFDGAPVALWEPALDPEDYFREVFRAASIRDLKRELQDGPSTRPRDRASIQQLETNGSIDVLGYEVHWNLYRSFLDHGLLDELGEHRRDVLLVQLDRRDELRYEYSNVRSTLESQGFSIQAHAIRANEHWWFSGNPSHSASTLKAVVAATGSWLNTTFKRR